GYRALTQGMVAVAAGDAEEAQRQARKADVLLAEPPLTLLLSAQAAQLGGDEDAARRFFSEMLNRPETEFLGLRGLLMQAGRGGGRPGARRQGAGAGARLRPGGGRARGVAARVGAGQSRRQGDRGGLAPCRAAAPRRGLRQALRRRGAARPRQPLRGAGRD